MAAITKLHKTTLIPIFINSTPINIFVQANIESYIKKHIDTQFFHQLSVSLFMYIFALRKLNFAYK